MSEDYCLRAATMVLLLLLCVLSFIMGNSIVELHQLIAFECETFQ